MLTFVLHWPDGDVTAVVDVDKAVGPYETATIDRAPDEVPLPIVVSVALTLGTKRDFLRFLEARTQGSQDVVRFAATPIGMENLENLFPGGGPIEQNMPLPAADSSANDDSDG